jgi:formylmethanofuran dehydrogenase subunit E
MTKRKTQEQAREMFASRGATMVGEYVTGKTPVECVCDACGATVWPTYGHVQGGRGACALCGNARAGQAQKIPDEVVRAAFAKRGAAMVGEYVTGKTPVECVCDTCGETIWPTYENIRSGQGACKSCGQARTNKARKIPDEVVRAAFAKRGATMVGKYVNSHKPVECVCDTCGETIWPTYGHVQSGRGACVYCAGRATKTQEQARKMFAKRGAAMVGEYVGNHKPVECVCDACGETIWPRYSGILRGRGACVYCAGQAPKTQEQARAMFAKRGATMVGEYVRANDPIEATCKTCGATVWPTYNNIQGGRGACSGCAATGYDPTKPGWLYLMAGIWDGLPWLKVGITNNDPADRAKRVGGTIIDSVLHESGADAHRDEQEILGQLGDLRGTGIPEGGDGYTESWSAWLMTVTTLTELRERYAVAA